MGTTRKVWATRVKTDHATFVAADGQLFYNEENGTLRIGDGVTPGGQPVNLLGTTEDIQLGNFLIDGSTFTTTELNADIGIYANGTGSVEVGGGLRVVTSEDSTATTHFSVDTAGKVVFLVPNDDVTAGGIEVIGATAGGTLDAGNTGVMLHVTGQQDTPNRIYADGVNDYPVYIGRRYNGTPAAPTAVLANDIIARYGSNAYDGTDFAPLGVANISVVASQNHTPSAKGSRIEFYTIADNSTVLTRGAYINDGGFVATNLTTTGRANITNTNITTNTPLLTVSANEQGLTKIPALAGTVAEFTGKDNQIPYLVFDAYGTSSGTITNGQFVFRTGRGTNASPSAVQANDVLGQIGGAGWGATGYGGVFASQIKFVAAENFTDSARGGKLIVSLIPQGSNSPQDVLTVTPTTVTLANNGAFEGRVKLNAGTASAAPLQFQAGDTLTTPLTGAMNFDGRAFYGTAQDLEKGIIPTEMTYVLNATLNLTAGVTTAQSLFGVGFTVSGNTRYHYRIKAQIAKNGSSSNQPTINFGIALSNGATLFAHAYWAYASVTATAATPTATTLMSNYITTEFNTGVPITGAMPIATSYANIEIFGYIDVNVGGTITPQIAFSDAPNTSANVQPKASMRIFPTGEANVNTSIGTWA